MTDAPEGNIAGRPRRKYDKSFEQVRRRIERTLSDSPPVIGQYLRYLLKAQGKHIRARSLLACAMDGRDLIDENAVTLASAVEILHLATLVHDDIIDDADIRRGIPALHRRFGRAASVICGDYLFSLSLSLAASVPNRQDYAGAALPDYVVQICLGELGQHVHSGNLDLSAYDYLKIAAGKTAALFEASFHAGAMLCGCGPGDVARYRRLGRYAGMIFQLTDDCMDFEAAESVALKPVQSDAQRGVITLPLIHALGRSETLRRELKSDKADRAFIARAVAELGGLDYARGVARSYYAKCLNIIGKLDPSPEKRTRLLSILAQALREGYGT